MLGGGGSVYWGRKSDEFNGIVLIFSWPSIPRKHLKTYVDLYSSLGWNSLVSHADFLTAFDPDKALSLAFILLNELIEKLRHRPCPVVFVAFSGGTKACMYKILQIIQETCEGHINQDERNLLRNCISGHIYDSGPVDFTTDMGAQFALPLAIQKMPGPSKFVSWFVKGIVSSLDGLYHTSFGSQRAEYWQALFESVDLGAPYLVLCSESDHLAPCRSIHRFVQRLQHLGGDVELVKWNISSHVGHYMHYPIQYRAAVTNLLDKATHIYSQRIQQLREGIGLHGVNDQMSEVICNLKKAADSSNQSLRRVAVGPTDHFFVPNSAESDREKSVCAPNSPSINANSVLGQMLFDVCVPKNVEGWDIRFCSSLNGQPISSANRLSPFRGMKFRRSKL